MKKLTFGVLFLSLSIWAMLAIIVMFMFPNLADFLSERIISFAEKFQSKGISEIFSITLTVLPSYLLVVTITVLVRNLDEWFAEKEFRKKNKLSIILILLGILSLNSSKLNAQDPSESLDESVYMENALVTYFQRETSFFDSLMGALSFPESYEVKETGTQIRLNTFVWEGGKNNFLWIGIFDKGNPEPLSEKEFSFKNLEKFYNDLKKEEAHSEKITRDISLLIPIGDNPERPGEHLIIIGEIFDEEGKQAGAFEIGYNTGNLLLNRKNSWQGYPKSRKYKYSKVHAWECKVIKLSNYSLNYPSQK